MLKHQIINLIQEKREGSYWDFKAEYHKDKAELLHDIICLSNNLPNQEAYLILGVADNGHILGITGDSNRKNQEELISFITGKKFAAVRHPKISLMTFEYEEKEIDFIIINPKGYVPYYLEKAETDKKSKKIKQSMQVVFIQELKIKIPPLILLQVH